VDANKPSWASMTPLGLQQIRRALVRGCHGPSESRWRRRIRTFSL
jgi:hypothetical protein